MNRRGFLRSMFALAAAAAVTPAAVAIAPDQNNKYREAIRLFDRCVAADKSEVNSRFDQLLSHLKKNFAAPEFNQSNIDATVQLLANPSDIAGIRGIPPSVADSIYPIALAKLGLKEYQLALDPSKMKEFDWFHSTYGRLILEGSEVLYQASQKKTV